MRTFLTAAAMITLLASPVQAATYKVVWNQPIDSPANVAAEAFVTSQGPHACLQDSVSKFACWNEHDDEDDEDETELF